MVLLGVIVTLCGVILLVLCLLIRLCLLVVTVQGQSMTPTLEPGDRILALRLFPRRWIRKERLVLVWPPTEVSMMKGNPAVFCIKRVVALERETFSQPCGEQTWDIPLSHIFVCGDNREQSTDSRLWGPLPLENVRGLALLKLPRKSSQPPLPAPLVKQGLPVGQVAPPFTVQTLHGETVTLSHYQGQNVLFLFIAAGKLIRIHLPSYLALAPGAAAQQTSIVLISISDRHLTQALVEELQIPLPVLIAPADNNPFLGDYHLSSIPSYCLVNREGKVQSSGGAIASSRAWRSLLANFGEAGN